MYYFLYVTYIERKLEQEDAYKGEMREVSEEELTDFIEKAYKYNQELDVIREALADRVAALANPIVSANPELSIENRKEIIALFERAHELDSKNEDYIELLCDFYVGFAINCAEGKVEGKTLADAKDLLAKVLEMDSEHEAAKQIFAQIQ